MSEFKVEIKGLDRLLYALKMFPEKFARKQLRKGVAAGGFVVRKAIRAAAPVRKGGGPKKISWSKKGGGGWLASDDVRHPGFLKKKIGSRYRKHVSTKWDVHYGIGPIGPAYYGYIVARGHATKGGGFVQARNFITPAFEGVRTDAIRAMIRKTEDGLIKEAKILGFKVFKGGRVSF